MVEIQLNFGKNHGLGLHKYEVDIWTVTMW